MSMSEELKHYVTDPTQCVKIAQQFDNKISALEPVTIPELFGKVVKDFGDNVALVQKNMTTKEWESITYAEYKHKVEKIAKVFIKLGLKRHGTVAVLAHNSIEWFVSGMAAIHAG